MWDFGLVLLAWIVAINTLTLHLAVPKTRLGADMQTKRVNDTLVDLKNRQLGAAIFVQGYVQLDFSDAMFTAHFYPTVRTLWHFRRGLIIANPIELD
jgi:hypothetical protein